MVFTLRRDSHVGAHLQKNFNELLLLCAPTWSSSWKGFVLSSIPDYSKSGSNDVFFFFLHLPCKVCVMYVGMCSY